MNTATEQKTTNNVIHESASDEHRLRSERIAARGVRLGKGKIKYLLALAGLAVLASVAFAQS
ncbi:hypothetical protein [Duganella sp. S19_KUP01_CR8]|uniref:hypothetical protein n=1 Tax=Duganella TaxID=75654 RepID=UPI002FCDA428